MRLAEADDTLIWLINDIQSDDIDISTPIDISYSNHILVYEIGH